MGAEMHWPESHLILLSGGGKGQERIPAEVGLHMQQPAMETNIMQSSAPVPGSQGPWKVQLWGRSLAQLSRENGLLWGLCVRQVCQGLLVLAAAGDLPRCAVTGPACAGTQLCAFAAAIRMTTLLAVSVV